MVSPNPIACTIILIFGLQALLLSLLLLLKKPKSQSNFFLALILFFFALMTINIGMATILFSKDLVHIFRYVQLELLYGIGPALYFFTKSITDKEYIFSKKYLIHFIPVILEFFFYRTEFYRLGANGLYEEPNHQYSIVYLTEQWLGVISISVYVILSVRIFINYQQWIKNNYSSIEDKSLGWLRIPVFVYSGYWILWTIITKIDHFVFHDIYREMYFLPTNIGLSIVTTWIGFLGYMKSHTDVTGFHKAFLKRERTISNPDEANLIVDLMKKHKPHLNPELDLQKLSDLAGMNTKTISRIINQQFHMNFYEFVNKYRIEEFQNRLKQQDHDQLTLLGHAFECGFNSKSTFNDNFKKYTELTPREYYLKLKNSPNGSIRSLKTLSEPKFG